MRRLACLITSFLLAVAGTAPHDAVAATLCVNPGGTGGCFSTLQGAVDAAASRDVIEIAAGTWVGSTVLGPNLAKGKLTIHGAGAGQTILSGGGSPGWATVLDTGSSKIALTISDLTITGGEWGITGLEARLTLRTCEVIGNVQGICFGGKKLTIDRCTVSGNQQQAFAFEGGGISLIAGNKPSVTIASSTFANNVSHGNGGAIRDNALAKIAISNSTLYGNTALQTGGAIYQFGGKAKIKGSTIAGNSAAIRGGGFDFAYAYGADGPKLQLESTILADNTAPQGPNCSGNAQAGKLDLIEDATGCNLTVGARSLVLAADPALGALQDNGGTTLTAAPLPGSPALGVVTTKSLCKLDQTGAVRTAPCDLGAVEVP